MIIRTLLCKEKGFLPIGYEYPKYSTGLSNSILRHDLYEHQPHELGYPIDELRAGGAFYRYHGIMIGMCDAFQELFEQDVPQDRMIDAPVIFHDWLGNIKNKNYWLSILMNGYNYALQFPLDAYNRFRDIDFKYLHKLGKDVKIDMMRGEVIK